LAALVFIIEFTSVASCCIKHTAIGTLLPHAEPVQILVKLKALEPYRVELSNTTFLLENWNESKSSIQKDKHQEDYLTYHVSILKDFLTCDEFKLIVLRYCEQLSNWAGKRTSSLILSTEFFRVLGE
jgi:hypothetical protein